MKYIKEKRPNLKESSIKTYYSILSSLYNKIYSNKDYEIKNFDDYKKILDYLKDKEFNKRKTILSALYILTDNENYKKKMIEDIEKYNNNNDKQIMSDKMKENWVEVDFIKEKLNKYEEDYNFLYKKKNKDYKDYNNMLNYIILLLYSGLYIQPRRSKDYIDFVIKDIDEKKDNYLKGNKLIFTSYKTNKFYGVQEIPIDLKFKNILLKWIKINPTKYLLFDSNYNKLNAIQLNQRLNKMFDNKKISVNQLRHIFLTDKYKEQIEIKKEIKKDMENMGSSINQFTTYVKN